MAAIDRTPRGALYPLRVVLTEEEGLDPDSGKWTVICHAHLHMVSVDTKADAMSVRAIDFCEACMDGEEPDPDGWLR